MQKSLSTRNIWGFILSKGLSIMYSLRRLASICSFSMINIMLNEKDPSGMYSKTGRILYEKLHILRKKDEILNPEVKKHNVLSTAAEMDELVRIVKAGKTFPGQNT